MHTTMMLLALAFAAGADDRSIQEVKQAIEALNEAFEKQDAAAIRRLTTEDHQAITPYYGGSIDRDEQLKTLPDLRYTEYAASDMKVTLVSPDVALITYRLTLKGDFKGKRLAERNVATALWVKRGGRWLEAAYQETPLDGK